MAHPTRLLALAVFTVAAISLLLPQTSCKSAAEETDDTVGTLVDLEALYDTERTPSRDRRDADHNAILRGSSSDEIAERKKRGFRPRRRPKITKNKNRSRRSRRKGSIGSGVGDALTGVASGLGVASSAMDLANTMQVNNADNENDSADDTERKKRGFRLRRRSRRRRNRNRSRRSRRKGSKGSGVGDALPGVASGLDSGMDLANTIQANNADKENDSAGDTDVTE